MDNGDDAMNKAAQALGRMAAGKPKNFSAAELERRKKRLAEARQKRWPAPHLCGKITRRESRAATTEGEK